MSHFARTSVALLTATALLVGAPAAFGKAVDDLGAQAAGPQQGQSQFAWAQLVEEAHAEDPKLAIFWPHPTGRAHGQDAVKDELAQGDDTFECAGPVERYTAFYRSYAYEQYEEGKRSTPPSGYYYVDVSNSTQVCTDLWAITDPTTAITVENGFTVTGQRTLHLSKRVGKRNVHYSVKADEYTDTATSPSGIVALSDCFLVFKIKGTTITVHASRSNLEGPDGHRGTAPVSCAMAASFAGRMHQLRYVKG